VLHSQIVVSAISGKKLAETEIVGSNA